MSYMCPDGRLLACYQRMSDPQPRVVDASGTRDEVLEAVLDIKAQAGI